jgi:hypothetical protein
VSASRVTDVEYTKAPLGQRAKPALQLSIGIVKPGAKHPEKLDYFRAKPGPYSARFHEVFGDKPTEVRIQVPDDLPNALSIAWKAYGKSKDGQSSYLKALGKSNYVERALTGDTDVMNGPEKLTVWQQDGRKGEVEISGPTDPIVAQTGLKLYTTFRFWCDEVIGVGSWGEIATTGEVSTHNLFRVLFDQWRRLHGQWVGLPLVMYLQEMTMRPTLTDDAGVSKRISSKGWAIAVRTPLSVLAFKEQLAELASIQTRAALPPVAHDSVERDLELSPGLWNGESDDARVLREQVAGLPTAPDEPLRTREEASSVSRADDATANRIAMLRLELGTSADSLLVGAFGVEDPAQLTAETAAAYLSGLERLHEQESGVDEEVVDESEATYEPPLTADGDEIGF